MFIKGIIWVLITGIIWGAIGVVFSRVANKKEYFYSFLFLSSLFFFVMSCSMIVSTKVTMYNFLILAAIMLPAGLFGQLGFLFMRNAMNNGNHGISWCMAQSAMVCPFLFGILCLGDLYSSFQLVGIGVLGFSLIPLGLSGNSAAKNDSSAKGKYAFIYFAFLAFIFLGLQQSLSLCPSYVIPREALNLRVPLLSVAGLLWIIEVVRKREKNWKQATGVATIYSILIFAGQWTMFKAIDSFSYCDNSNIAYPLAIGTSIVIFGIYSYTVRKEKLKLWGVIGMIFAIYGIILLAIR